MPKQTASISAGLATRPVQGGEPTDYAAAVLAVVDRIPRGKVMSYGDVAEYVGKGSGRTVGAVMSRHGHEVPWHRVVQSTGGPNPASPVEALQRLRAEKTPMRGDKVNMRLARWDGRQTMTDDVNDLHRRALDEFGRRVHAVRADQWGCPTPCKDWEVRNLVNHLVAEQLWVPPLLAGKRIADLGGDFATGDVLGADPIAAWDAAAAAASAAFAEPGALTRTVHLSYADRPAEEYAREMIFDLVVHSWDLARGISVDDAVDPDLVEAVYGHIEPDADFSSSGLFDPPVPVPADADEQTRLIALTGRTP